MEFFYGKTIICFRALLVLFYAYTGVILFGMVRYGQDVSKYALFKLCWKSTILGMWASVQAKEL